MNIFDPKNNFEWRDYLKILKLRKWYFILPFVLGLTLGVLKIVSTKPIYKSSCSIQIQLSNPLTYSLKRVVPGVLGSGTAYAFEKEILSSGYLLQLIHRLDLHKDNKIRQRAKLVQTTYPDKNLEEIIEILLIEKLRKNIWTKNYGSDIVEINVTGRSPEFTYNIAKTLTDISINEFLRSETSNIQSALRFNDEQIAIFKKKLEQAEHNLESYKRNLISNKVKQQPMSGESLKSIQDAIVAIEITVNEKKDYSNYLRSQLQSKNIEVESPNSLTIQNIKGKIDEKIAQMAILMKRYSWSSAQVIKINRSINDLRENMKNEFESLFRQKYPNMQVTTLSLFLDEVMTMVDLEILNRKKEVLNQTIASFSHKAAQNPSKELALSKLQEEVATNRRIYNMLLEQSQGTQIEEAMQQADASSRFKILEPPRRPIEPINAGFRMILLVSLVAASGLGAGVVYLREYLDNSIRTVQEAEEYFEIPIIGVVPHLDAEDPNLLRKWLVYSIVAGILIVFAGLIVFFIKTNNL